MAHAADYPVTFGYNAQDGFWYGPYGKIGRYHKGNDRPTPKGIPIVIGGTTIGKTGKTGKVSGAHLHTQAGTDKSVQSTIDPTPYEFKPGKVVAVGVGNQWGKYIIIQVGSRYVAYAHLDSINVSVGRVIKEGQVKGENTMAEKVSLETARRLAYGLGGYNGITHPKNALGGDIDDMLKKQHVGKALNAAYVRSWQESALGKKFIGQLPKLSGGEHPDVANLREIRRLLGVK